MTIYAAQETLPGACGVSCFFEFDTSDNWHSATKLSKEVPMGGIGLVCAGFIENNETCDKAFKQMSKRWKMVYRSPTRTNRNSGNRFYFAVFDAKKSEKSKYGFKDNSGDSWDPKHLPTEKED